MQIPHEVAHYAYESLVGTCHGLNMDNLQEEFEGKTELDWDNMDLELDILVAAEDIGIFNCVWCGWWCEIGDETDNEEEANGEQVCTDCIPNVDY